VVVVPDAVPALHVDRGPADLVAVVVAEAAAANVTRNDQLPKLGIGLGLRQAYFGDVFQHRSQIDFLEIVADHFFDTHPRADEYLELFKNHFPIIPHGLALSLGSVDGLDRDYLERLRRIVERVNPPWWSEHIAFTRAGGIDIGHLTPLPKSRQTLSVLRSNIRQAMDAIEKPLILENITETIRFPQDHLDEASFLGQILDENECGLLLDVTNLYTNSVNLRFDPLHVLSRLPSERIVQLHFAGGHWDDEYLVDSHSQSTPKEVWQLLEEVVQYAPLCGIILERDERLPPIAELIDELERARSIATKHGRFQRAASVPISLGES
jgi:uncharacterized protein (UPF0276 family)